MASGIKFDVNQLRKNIDNFDNKFNAAVDIYAEQAALKFQNYARKNRRWTDRTGHARQRLTGYRGKITHGYRIYISHGVQYGIFLEKAHEQKYAILDETVLKVGSEEVMPGFKRFLDRVQAGSKVTKINSTKPKTYNN